MLTAWTKLKQVPIAVWLIALGHGVTDLSPGALYVALPFIKAKLGLTYAEVSIIVLMQNITSSISQPIFGYYCDKKSRAYFMPAGTLLCGLALLGSLVSPNYYFVLLFTALSGLGNAAFHPEAAKWINRLSGRSAGKGASLFGIWGSIGVSLGSLFLAFLLEAGNPLFLWLYLLPFALCTPLLLYVTKNLPTVEAAPVAGLRQLKASINWSISALLGMVAARATISSSIGAFVPLYYISYLNGSALYASSLLMVYSLSGAVGTMLGGICSDKYGSKPVMIYSILPLSLLLYVFRDATGLWPFIILAIISILLSATFTSSLVLIQKMMPGNIGMASGLNLGFSVGLGTMGVLLLGKAADLWTMPIIFDILVVLPVIAFILTLFVREPALTLQTAKAESM